LTPVGKADIIPMLLYTTFDCRTSHPGDSGSG
jgi:hypothetical protein